eukprot:3161724-Alexandrium_andersonii.AAC.1
MLFRVASILPETALGNFGQPRARSGSFGSLSVAFRQFRVASRSCPKVPENAEAARSARSCPKLPETAGAAS